MNSKLKDSVVRQTELANRINSMAAPALGINTVASTATQELMKEGDAVRQLRALNGKLRLSS